MSQSYHYHAMMACARDGPEQAAGMAFAMAISQIALAPCALTQVQART